MSLANLGSGRFRMVALEGVILDEAELPKIEMPYFFLRPKSRTVEETATFWLENARHTPPGADPGKQEGSLERFLSLVGNRVCRCDMRQALLYN